MASEKDLEILDEYAGNRLNAQEKAAFEQQLESDAELKNELMLQQRVIESIRKARTAELKKMLNDIPMSSIPSEGMSSVVKIGLLVVVAGMVATGLYFYFDGKESAVIQPITNEIKAEEPTDIKSEESQPAAESSDGEQQPQESATQAVPQAAEKQTSKTPVTAPAASAEKTEDKPVEPSALDVFDPSKDQENAEEPVAEGAKPSVTTKPSIIVETETDKRYNFHYQFKNDKLYLYGSFEKNLYEIMEFFSDNKRTMFLFYKDNYYLLNEDDDKVKPLAPINDATLLKKLKDYRRN